MKPILLLLAALFTNACMAQRISAVLADQRTRQPVAYANVGIAGKDVGTVTDDLGRFGLDIAAGLDQDSLTLSMIGYEARKIRVADLLRLGPAGDTLFMTAQAEHLKEVVVRAVTPRHRLLGNTANKKNQVIGFDQYRPGYEVGTYIRIKHPHTRIDSVRINVAKCDYDSVFLRLNIYEAVGDTFVNVLNEPLYISAATATALKNITINLADRDIVVEHPIVLAVELVKDLGGKEMYFCAQIPGHKGYMRVVSQGDWHQFAIGGPSFSAYVTY